MRGFGHVKGYWGESIVLVCYTLFLFHMAKILIDAVLKHMINTTNYSCSHRMHIFLVVSEKVDLLIYPLTYQLMFIAIMWQLSRICSDAQAVILND